MTSLELRALRKRFGLTQAKFAAALGLSTGRLHNYEAGIDRTNKAPCPVPLLVQRAARDLARELDTIATPR
jgi:DNA-binding transcriptional regulator YiaG